MSMEDMTDAEWEEALALYCELQSKIDDQPRCSICKQWMLGGVPGSWEPKWYCPDHPLSNPLLVEKCLYCDGTGFIEKS
jgi:hypothetical protein